jgi:hypothetical protein
MLSEPFGKCEISGCARNCVTLFSKLNIPSICTYKELSIFYICTYKELSIFYICTYKELSIFYMCTYKELSIFYMCTYKELSIFYMCTYKEPNEHSLHFNQTVVCCDTVTAVFFIEQQQNALAGERH